MVFEGKSVFFSPNEWFYLREISEESAFSRGRHYNVGSKMRKNDVFEVGYLEHDNSDPSCFIKFSDRGSENVQYREV